MERFLPRLRMPMTRLWTTLLFSLLSLAVMAQGPFSTIWKTDNDGPSEDYEIRVPATGDFIYYWINVANLAEIGSGSGRGETTITFPRAGTYQLNITPMGSTPFHRIEFIQYGSNDKNKLLEVSNWGTIPWSGFLFNGCSNLKITATDIPDLSGVTDLSFAFSNSGINAIPNINDWDVSNVTDLSSLFQKVTGFNQSLSNWDVSHVTNMAFMFDGATSFNQPLDSWDVSSLEYFDYLFRDASSFNQSLGAWNLASFVGAVGVFFRSGMSCENYSYTLYGWATNPNTNEGAMFHPWSSMEYSPAVVPYRDFLIENLGWDISGDALGTCSVTLPGSTTPDDNNILYVDINVDTDATGYTGAGNSWANAIPELADALKWARLEHDGGSPGWTETDPLRIFVAKGEYKPLYNAADGAYTTDGGAGNSFVLVPDVQLYGGFDPSAGIETLDDARILPNHEGNATAGTVLSGDLNGNDAIVAPTFDRANHPSRQDNAHRVVSAFEISDNARLDGFTITGANYSNTSTSGHGGGLFLSHSSPTLSNLFITNNSITYSGGGMYLSKSTSAISNVIISNNTAYNGAGMYTSEVVGLTLTNVTITNNVASGSGGGIHHFNLHPDNLILTNTTIAGNAPDAIYAWDPLSGNNVIVWGGMVNRDDQDPGYGFKNSLIEGNTSTADGNLNATGITAGDIFTDVAAGDYTLKENSPAIDAGSNALYTGAGGSLADDVDVAGNPRVYNQATAGVIDMGAYEYQGETDAYHVYVVTPAGETFTIPAESSDSFQQLKQKIDDQEGIPMEEQRLAFNGKEMPDGRILGDYGIVSGNTLHLWLPIVPDGATILYVNKHVDFEANGYTGAGDSWENALTELSTALNYAHANEANWTTTAPLQIWVAKGVYKPLESTTYRQRYFNLLSNVAIYGGFAAAETALDQRDVEANITVLSGDIGGDDESDENGVLDDASKIRGNNSFHVVDGSGTDRTAILNGFTITAGQANVGPTTTDKGGGIFMENGSPTLERLIISGNTADYGGGINIFANSSPILRHLIIRGNTASFGGGGISNVGSPLTSSNILISGNRAQEGGGVFFGSAMTLTNVTISGNTAMNGGGLAFFPMIAVVLNNSILWGNSATSEGNESAQSGLGSTSTLTLHYSLYRNRLGESDNMSHVDADAFTLTTSPNFISTDPTEIGFLQLGEGSPAINAGNNQLYTDAGGDLVNDKDVAGNPRLTGSTIDMGAYESGVLPNRPPEATNVAVIGELTVGQAVEGDYLFSDDDDDDESGSTYAWYRADDESGTGKAAIVDSEGVTYVLTGADIGKYISFEVTPHDGADAGMTVESTARGPVERQALTVTGSFTAHDKRYDGDESAEINSDDLALDGLINGLTDVSLENLVVSFDDAAIADGKTVRIMNVELAGPDAAIYELDLMGLPVATANITRASLTITDPVLTLTKAYDGTTGAEVEAGILSGAVAGEEVTVIAVATYADVDAASGKTIIVRYTIAGADAGNYSAPVDFVSTDGIISPIPLTIVGLAASDKIYDGTTTVTVAGTPAYDGLLAGESFDVSGEADWAFADPNVGVDKPLISSGNYEVPSGNYTLTQPTLVSTITALEIMVTVDDQTKVFAVDDPALTYTFTPELIDDDAFTGELEREEGENVSTYAITQGNLSLGDNYEITFQEGTLTISPLEITVTAEDKSKAFGAGDPALTYTFTPELIGDDAFAGGLDREEGETVGDYAITQGNLSLDDNYEITFEEGTLTITRADYDGVEFNNAAFVYDGTEHTLTLVGELPEGASVNYEIDGEGGNGATDAGTYAIRAIIDGGDNYEDMELTATLTITPLEITVMAADKTKVFGADDPALTYTYTPELIGDDAFSGALSRDAGNDVGDYAITQGNLSAGGNYTILYEAGTFAITPAGYDGIALNSTSFTYDGTEHTLSLTGDLPAGASVTYTIDGEAGNSVMGVGAYAVKAIIDGGANYEDAELNATLTIAPLEITVTAEDRTKVFGTADPALTYTSTPELIGDDAFSGALSRDAGNDVGEYAITQGNLSAGGNYTIVFEAGTFAITPAGHDGIALNSTSFTYDGTEHTLSLTGDLPAGVSVTYTVDGEAGNSVMGVGAYAVKAIIDGGANYEDAELNATLTIAPLEITVTAEDRTKVFGTADPALTYTSTPELIGDDAFSGALSRDAGNDVGEYAITQGNLSAGGNYTIVFEAGTFAITPAGHDGIALNSTSFTYDGTEHTLSLTGDLPAGASVTYTIDGEAGNSVMGVGAYAVKAIIDGGANYEDAELNATLTITPLEITVTAEDRTKVFGAADPALTYTHTPELIGDDAFSGALSRDAGNGVGEYAITQGNLSAGSNYTIVYEAGTLTVTPAGYDGIALNSTSFTYDGTEHTLSLTGDLPAGASVTYTVDGEAGNSATDAGTYAVKAIIDGGANYEDAELNATLTIAPLEITVTAEDRTKVFGAVDPMLTYTHAPELIGDDVFEGDLDREEGEAVGDYAITQGNLSAGGNYTIVFEAGTFAITPAGYDGIALNSTSFTYDGTEHTLSLTGDLPAGASVTYTVDGEAGNSATDAGTYAVKAIIDGGANYEDAELNATLTIAPLEITVTAEDRTKVFGTADPALTYTHTPELIGDDAFSGALSRDAGNDVGDYAITQGNLSAGSNYTIVYEAGTLTVTPAGYDGIALNSTSFTYDGTEHTLSLTGDLPAGASVTYTVDGEAGNGAMDAGTYAVKEMIDGGANYEDAELTATLTIAPLEITVTAVDKTKAFGADDPALTYMFTPELIGDDVFEGNLDREEGEAVGDYAITQGNLSAGGNYTIVFEAGTFAITPAGYDGIALNSTSFTYDGTEHTLSLTGDLPAGASVTYTIDGEAGNSVMGVGAYAVKAIIDGGANYEDAELNATLTIAPLEITVTAEDRTKVFGTADPALTYTSTPELIGDDAFSGALSRDAGNDVGDYAITQGNLSAGGNYTIVFEAGTFAITPAGYDGIALNSTSFTYDGTEHTLSLTGDLPAGASVTYTIDGEAGNSATDAGTYAVKAIIDGGANYEDVELSATLTITPLEITVTAEDRTKVFGTADPALTYTSTPELIGDDAFSGALSRDAGNDVGDYAITQGNLSAGSNYTILYETGTLTVTPAGYDGIAFNSTSFTYDGTEHTLSLTGDLPAGASVTYTIDGEAGNSVMGVGAYAVKAIIDGGANYEDAELNATLIITPVSRHIDFPLLPEKTYGDGNFDAGASSSSGEAVQYTSSNPAVAEISIGGLIVIKGVGSTTITATVPDNRNYTDRPQVSRMLTITKSHQVITFTEVGEVHRDIGVVALTVSANSGLPVSLSVDDPEVATLEGTSLRVHRLGTVRVMAVQEGNDNYGAAAPVTITVRVVDPEAELPMRVSKVVSPNGDGINEYLVIEGIKDYPDNKVMVFNRNGTILYEAKGYNNGSIAFRGASTGQLPVPAGTYFYVAEIKVNGTWKYEKGWFVLRY